MSNQPNEKYHADKETMDALQSLYSLEDKIDKALYSEFGVGKWGAGASGLPGGPLLLSNVFLWAKACEKSINKKLEHLESLRQGELKNRTLTIVARVKAATAGNL
jgi:hypothetical protein